MHIDISIIDKYGINKRERFHLYDETALFYCSILAFQAMETKVDAS